MFDCTCNTQNSLLLNQHNGDDAPQDYEGLVLRRRSFGSEKPGTQIPFYSIIGYVVVSSTGPPHCARRDQSEMELVEECQH